MNEKQTNENDKSLMEDLSLEETLDFLVASEYDTLSNYTEKMEKLLQNIEKGIAQVKIDHAKTKSFTTDKRVSFDLPSENEIACAQRNTAQNIIDKKQNIIDKKFIAIDNTRNASDDKNINSDSSCRPYYQRFTYKNRLPMNDIQKLLASVETINKSDSKKKSKCPRIDSIAQNEKLNKTEKEPKRRHDKPKGSKLSKTAIIYFETSRNKCSNKSISTSVSSNKHTKSKPSKIQLSIRSCKRKSSIVSCMANRSKRGKLQASKIATKPKQLL